MHNLANRSSGCLAWFGLGIAVAAPGLKHDGVGLKHSRNVERVAPSIPPAALDEHQHRDVVNTTQEKALHTCFTLLYATFRYLRGAFYMLQIPYSDNVYAASHRRYTRFKPHVQGPQPNQETEAVLASNVSQHQPHVSG
jgi:hypothetical protein